MRASFTSTKVCLGLTTGAACWVLYKYLTTKPKDKFVKEIMESGNSMELAEECLTEVSLDQRNLTALTQLSHEFRTDDINEDNVQRVIVEAIHQQQVQERLAQALPVVADDAGKVQTHNKDHVIAPYVHAVKASIGDSSPQLEARATRVVLQKHKATYAKRVLEECKSKFGCPEVTKANHRAVWRFAEQIMKDHGLRPSHRVALLPYIVQLCFVPDVNDILGERAAVTARYFSAGAMADHMSHLERWTHKLKRLFWVE